MNREKSIDRLYDSVMCECTITCTKCGEHESYNTIQEMQVAEEAHEKGWRGSPCHIYCPTCASKHLKSK